MGLIIIQFRNEDLAESALQLWNKEQVTISREDPRIKAKVINIKLHYQM